MLPWLRARSRALLNLLTNSFSSFILISKDIRSMEEAPRWIPHCGQSSPCAVPRAAEGFGLGLSTGTGPGSRRSGGRAQMEEAIAGRRYLHCE